MKTKHFENYFLELRKRNAIHREKVVKDENGAVTSRAPMESLLLPLQDIVDGTSISYWYLEKIAKGRKIGETSRDPYAAIPLEFIIRLSLFFNVSIDSFVEVIRRDMGQEVLGDSAKFGIKE